MADESLKITAAEVEAMLAATELGALGAVDAELIAFLVGEINAEALAANEAMFESIRASLTGTASPEALAAARAAAERNTATLITNMAKTEINKVGAVIADNIAAGKGPRAAIKSLDAVKGLDSVRANKYLKAVEALENLEPALTAKQIEDRSEALFKKLLQERKTSIAITEQRFATATANDIQARAAGKQFKSWITVGDNRVDPHCEANEAQGFIPIDETFDSGSGIPPDHPNCRCTLGYRERVTTAAADRASQRAANTKAALAVEAA